MPAIIDAVELSEAPSVRLGGRSFKVPKLAARQNKLVVPRIMALNGVDWEHPGEADLETLYSIVYIALTRATPALTRDEFDDLPLSQIDCLNVMPVIIVAAGLTPKNPPKPAAEAMPAP